MTACWSCDKIGVYVGTTLLTIMKEVPISHFFDLAYDTPSMSSPDSTAKWLKSWAAREFGAEVAGTTASVMDKYGMLAARRK